MPKEKNGLKYLIVIGVILLCLQFSKEIWGGVVSFFGFFLPILEGCIIAYIINIIMTKIEGLRFFPKPVAGRQRFRWLSILCSFGVILLGIFLLSRIIFPELKKALLVIFEYVPIYLNKLQVWLLKYSADWPMVREWVQALEIDWAAVAQRALNFVTSGVGDVFNFSITAVGVVSQALVNLVIAMVFAIYILASRENLLRQARQVLNTYCKNQHWLAWIGNAFLVLNETFARFVAGQCTEAVILGSLCALGMLILRIPYATMVGTLVGATALIPIFGAYIGAIIGSFMILTVEPVKVVVFLIFLVILQQLEGNLIYPRVVGSSIGLPGIWVFAAVTVGGRICGVLGMLLGVPLMASVYKLIKEDIRRRQAVAQKEQPREENGELPPEASGPERQPPA